MFVMKLINYLNKSENSVAILLAVAILSMSYPYGFPLFGILAIFFAALKTFTGKFKIRINIGFILFFFCVWAYAFGMVISQGLIYSNNLSDITNIISFFLIWILLSDLEKEDYQKLIHNFAKYAVLVSFVVSIISLYKFYQLLSGVKLQKFFVGAYYPPGSSLVRDYNMFSFAMTAGLIMTVYLLNQTKKTSHMIYYLLSFITIFTTILFSGSRRGWVVAVIVVVFVLFLILKFLFRLNKNFIKLIKFGFTASVITLFIYLVFALFNIDTDFQNSAQIQKLKYRLETLRFNQVEDSFSERTIRWDYAAQRFNESNPIQFLIGSGFSYLPDFGNKFNLESQEDYPHNPLLSALLYSGLLGQIFLLSLLIWSALMTFNNKKLLGMHYTFLFFVSWIFVLISFNSIFSSSLFMTMLLLITSIPNTFKASLSQ
jgi:MFS family permease